MCGGLAVSLGLLPDHVLLNDINPHAINFSRWLKKGLVTTLTMENDRTVFDHHRRRFNQLITNGGADSQEAAALFYYLNRTCFNGLCRFNNKGEFNVPFGKYKRITYTRDFTPYKSTFKSWELTCGDFRAIRLRKTDFVYADPPYDVEFTKYSKEDFKWDDQVRLAEWLAKHKGPVVVSNQATERIVNLYEKLGFEIRRLKAPRRISCDGDRTFALEVLAMKNLRTRTKGVS